MLAHFNIIIIMVTIITLSTVIINAILIIIPRYVTFETLFDTIHDDHVQKEKHTGRLLTYKDLSLRYANITMEHVIAYLDLCEVCQMKKGRAKKGVVVKPIVSSNMGNRAQVDFYYSY